MFKILLLLVLASCAKLNLNANDKSGKGAKSASSDSDKSWNDRKTEFSRAEEDRPHASIPLSSSGSSNNSGSKGRK